MPDGDKDPEAFAAEERAAWDSVAPAWSKWWRTFEAGAQPLNERLVELAGVAPGHRVLDIATGIGEPALTAARAVGTSGHVFASDLSAEMLAFARERASAEDLTHIEFAESDAERLDVAAGSFDAAVCRWGLMLMRDPTVAARRVHAALRPGGRFAAAVWSRPEEVPFLALAGRVLRRELTSPPLDPDEPGPFRLHDPAKLTRVFADAGFDELVIEHVPVTMRFESAATYALFLSEMSSSTRKHMAGVSEAERRRLLDVIEAEASEFTDTSGAVCFENRVLCAVGRVSSA